MENKTDNNLISKYCGMDKKHCLLRWILGAVILIIVFMFGFKAGKYSMLFSGKYDTGYYNYPMMSGSYYRMMPNYNYNQMNPWMMQGWGYGIYPQTGQPQTNPPR